MRLFSITVAAVLIVVCVPILVVAQPEQASGPDQRAARAGEVAQNPAQPPPGPIAPTDRIRLHKDTITLPFVIDQPGSYVLTSDLTGVAGADGIIIAASDVTIDLNGFALQGVEASLTGIQTTLGGTPPAESVRIMNGVICGWGVNGVQVFTRSGAHIASVTARDNGRTGIEAGSRATIESCQAHHNGRDGVNVGEASLIIDCLAVGNGDNGLQVGQHCEIRDSTSRDNVGSGVWADFGSRIVGSSSGENSGHGFELTAFVTMEDCVAQTNFGAGIWALWECQFYTCTSAGNYLYGILANNDTIVDGCVVWANENTGVRVLDRSIVRNCRIAGNYLVTNGDNQQSGELLVRTDCTVENNDILRSSQRGSDFSSLLVQQDGRGVFRNNRVTLGDVSTLAAVVTSNVLIGANLDATGLGVAPIVNSIAEAGPYDNIQLPF